MHVTKAYRGVEVQIRPFLTSTLEPACCRIRNWVSCTAGLGYLEKIKLSLHCRESYDNFYCRSYCLLNMFRAPLCPSSGAQEYYTVFAACGIWCCCFQVMCLVWSCGSCVRFAGCFKDEAQTALFKDPVRTAL